MALDRYNRAETIGAGLGVIDAAKRKAAQAGASALAATSKAGVQALQIADQAKQGALRRVATGVSDVVSGYRGGVAPEAAPAAPPTSVRGASASGKIRAATPAAKPSAPAAAPAAPVKAAPPARDRTGNSDPAVIAELAANKRRQEAQAPAAPAKNYQDITRNINQGITRGYDTSVRAPAAAPAAADEFNPSAELYQRAQRLLAAGQDEGDGGFNARIRAAIARKQGTRLMDTARQFYGEQGANTRAQLQESGAASRAQMQEDAARERLGISEQGAMTRAQMQNASELERTRAAGQNTMANTALQQQLARDAAIEKLMVQENMPSTQAKTLYDRVLTGKASAEEQATMQKVLATQAYLDSPEGTPQRGSAARTLATVSGRTDPAVQAALDNAKAIIKDPAARQEDKDWANAMLAKSLQTGFADGGAVSTGLDRGMGAPMGAPAAAPAMGMPDIQPQVQIVTDYRAYAAAAARLGATPVAFDQFASMKSSQAALPVAGFADGGLVEEPSMIGFAKYLLRGGRLADEQSTSAIAPKPKNPALDTAADAAGTIPAVGGAISNLRARQQALDEAAGFADGGAVRVAGKQVLGPGTGKSDSIPAIIDGETPAALSTGEFVFPIEAVRHFGMDKLNKMVEAARSSSSQ